MTYKLFFLFSFFLFPILIFAQSGIKPITPGELSIGLVIYNITNWLLGLIVALSLLLVVYAAFLILLGGAEPGNISKAKSILIWAAVALALGLGARIIISLTLYFTGLAPRGASIFDLIFGLLSGTDK
ncbi:MAG: hypothetical protein A2430_02305 [Candidatus Liptonbacteria bacterium RIFOXYC1_FULL_36_8]|uniref:Uncharacterized protein n=3 Tax=Candidatus Liptoniibacteriota TaxID=1817909 RepID=A0A1G2CP60_9BACT|nr:MAG: hypothetical protein A2390_00930 [Candidatus Liptonbacteria bacterium RIFOXYB1_FULL_36_10]OGZ02890.1 MAG: hypothetical protein A2430_02305 [Candidatus Liptonbacteria bacterium RIFOXYC1_FULL_36_8]OGZ03209.1 MAG: hypothetical protein A2604_01850 [Candidatus Liptonbacteria bacterium RIFOXYD1_FULL_36_11]